MATQYNYKNLNFCKSLVLRKEIQDINHMISGIVSSFTDAPSYFFEFIMEKFKNRKENQDYYVNTNNTSPINYLPLYALYYYKEYVANIVSDCNNLRFPLDSEVFKQIVIDNAQYIRDKATLKDQIETFTLRRSVPLPKYVNKSMYNKALATLKEAEPEIYETYTFENIKPVAKKKSEKVKKANKEATKELNINNKKTTAEKLLAVMELLEKKNNEKANLEKEVTNLKEELIETRYEYKASNNFLEASKHLAHFNKVNEQIDEKSNELTQVKKDIDKLKSQQKRLQNKLDKETVEEPVLTKEHKK